MNQTESDTKELVSDMHSFADFLDDVYSGLKSDNPEVTRAAEIGFYAARDILKERGAL